MQTSIRIAAAFFVFATVFVAPRAQAADLCIQLSGGGCDYSGQAGFFRFSKAKLPKNPKKSVPLHGRNAAASAVYGTMTMGTEGNAISIAFSFVQDATFGTVAGDIFTNNLEGTHSADASYGDVSLSTSCDLDIVDCDLEDAF